MQFHRRRASSDRRHPDPVSIILWSLAILFLIYYFTVGMNAGYSTSVLFVWPMASVILLLIDLVRRLHRRGIIRIPQWIRFSFTILLTGFILLFSFVEICILSGFRSDAPPDTDYLIVLGAKVNGEWPSLALELRIEAAYAYLAENPSTICVATGGKGEDEAISEAACIQRELIRRGISSERIMLEEQSVRTAGNLQNSVALIGDLDASVAVVSSNFHVFRGKALARKCGYHQVSGIPADFPELLLPHYLVREFVSVIVDTLLGNTAF